MVFACLPNTTLCVSVCSSIYKWPSVTCVSTAWRRGLTFLIDLIVSPPADLVKCNACCFYLETRWSEGCSKNRWVDAASVSGWALLEGWSRGVCAHTGKQTDTENQQETRCCFFHTHIEAARPAGSIPKHIPPTDPPPLLWLTHTHTHTHTQHLMTSVLQVRVGGVHLAAKTILPASEKKRGRTERRRRTERESVCFHPV